ncbi:hypothetical protein ACLD7X_016510, partial [Aphanothece microscopica RSMan92]
MIPINFLLPQGQGQSHRKITGYACDEREAFSWFRCRALWTGGAPPAGRVLNVVDDVTRECLAAIPDTSISGRRVARELSVLIER